MLGSAPGNPLTLECIVEGYPKPLVVWSFGGKYFSLVLFEVTIQIFFGFPLYEYDLHFVALDQILPSFSY